MPTTNRQTLTKAQKEALLSWISDGAKCDEINRRATAFAPPFQVSRPQVAYYRRSRAVQLKSLTAAGEGNALTQGLALRSERVKKLSQLAALLEKDLFTPGADNRLWVETEKMIGSGDNALQVTEEFFNAAEVKQYRGVLDDIAREVGGRRQIIEERPPEDSPVDLSQLNQEELNTLESLLQRARVAGGGGGASPA